jgi:GH35 family endo-1,4-beta-xylanase
LDSGVDGVAAGGLDASASEAGASGPTISLTASGNFFTSAGTLTLTAIASDSVALTNVEFFQDGVSVGPVATAPYAVNITITSALNGRHLYTATAHDVNGYSATAGTGRVLVAIGNKFFGTATTNAADYTGLLDHFNQITPGNAGKWGTVEAVQGTMNWTDLDTAYNFAKSNNLPFKLHTLVWGSQQPAWINSLPADQQLAAVDAWMAALAERYPNVDLIDVVNEPMHTQPSYIAALGGAGATGWDWVIKAFEMARAHFPNAELLLNDYFVLPMDSFTTNYLAIVNLLNDRSLIDGIGEQGHFYERADLTVLTSNLGRLAATGLPLYISELDLNFADDARHAVRMSQLFPIFWSNPSVVGVTHWGYRQGNMWQTNAYLIRSDGTLRPALTWLECYRAGGTDCSVPVYVPQPRIGDSTGLTIEAEDYDAGNDVLAAGTVVAYTNDGSWLRYDVVTFDNNWDTLSVSYARGATLPANLTVHFDSLDNAPVTTFPLAATGDWSTMQTVSIPWAPVTGAHNVFFRFNGGGANLDKMWFGPPAGTGKNLLTDSDFEQGTTSGWSTWGAGTIANTTARAVSGTHSLAMTGRSGNPPLAQWLTSTVLPGKTYKVDVWATIGGTPPDTAFVTTAIQCSTDSSVTYGRLGGWSNSKTIADGAWVEFTGDLEIPDCALTQVQIWLEGPATADLYMDHVSVRQKTSSNIIPNGTFESGTSGWYTWSGATLSATTARAHSGLQSLLVSPRTTNNSPAATDLTSLVKAGTNYPFSLWVSIDSPDSTSKSIHVTQATSCKAEDGTISTAYGWIAGAITVPDSTGWTQFSGTVAIPTASSCTLSQVQVYVEGDVGADLYVDDVQVIDNSGIPTNLIPDGTFESGQGSWGGWGEASVAVTATSAHSGLQSLLGSSMNNGALARDIKALVSAGKRYQATAWVSVGNLAAGSGSVGLQTVQNCNTDASDSYPWLAGATVANGAWVQVTGTVDLTSCTTVNKLLLFLGEASGDLYVDDVSLTALP